MLRRWIATLSWLVFIKRLHSLITHHMRGRLVGCTDRVTLGLLCVCVCVFVCVWQPSTFEDHPKIWCIPQGTRQKRCCTKYAGENKNLEQEGTYSPVLPVCVFECQQSLFEKSLSTFKVFAVGNLNKLCALQHHPTGRSKNTDLKFSACTWLCHILQLFFC